MATKKRLIDANVLGRDSFHIMCEGEDGEVVERCVVDWDDIETAPTVDAVEVVHGRWEDVFGGKYQNKRYRCSVCKEKALFKFRQDELLSWHEEQKLSNYCPNCGAKMDGDGNG